MKQYLIASILSSVLLAGLVPADGTNLQKSVLVHLTPCGDLAYTPYTDKGDCIPDFSTCGYRGGGVAFPVVPVKVTVRPGDSDDTARIQAAIDTVSRLPLSAAGMRGAVLVKKGQYQLSGTIRIAASGVVLRGEGEGEDGTVLLATGKRKRTLIEIAGEGTPLEVAGTRRKIRDAYVPVGARTFTVENGKQFSVGQTIMVVRPSKAAWIHELGMDCIPQNAAKNIVQWKPGSKDLAFDRIITAVSGNRITVDAPIVNAIQSEYGGGYIYRYTFPGRITEVGIEQVRGDSEFNPKKKKGRAFVDEAHGWNFITVNAAENVWIRHVTSIHFGYSCVTVKRQAKRVTVEHSSCLDPVSLITGGRRYSFGLSGQLCLVKDCFSRRGRHDFVMHATVPGPNVFLDCQARNTYSTSEPHHRWSAGVLYDNVVIEGNGYLQAINRGNSGSGHGWAGAQIVFWNCRAPVIIATKPHTAQNFIIGFTGTFRPGGVGRGAVSWANKQGGKNFSLDSACVGDAHIESPAAPVEPRSLYNKQLENRLRNRQQ